MAKSKIPFDRPKLNAILESVFTKQIAGKSHVFTPRWLYEAILPAYIGDDASRGPTRCATNITDKLLHAGLFKRVNIYRGSKPTGPNAKLAKKPAHYFKLSEKSAARCSDADTMAAFDRECLDVALMNAGQFKEYMMKKFGHNKSQEPPADSEWPADTAATIKARQKAEAAANVTAIVSGAGTENPVQEPVVTVLGTGTDTTTQEPVVKKRRGRGPNKPKLVVDAGTTTQEPVVKKRRGRGPNKPKLVVDAPVVDVPVQVPSQTVDHETDAATRAIGAAVTISEKITEVIDGLTAAQATAESYRVQLALHAPFDKPVGRLCYQVGDKYYALPDGASLVVMTALGRVDVKVHDNGVLVNPQDAGRSPSITNHMSQVIVNFVETPSLTDQITK